MSVFKISVSRKACILPYFFTSQQSTPTPDLMTSRTGSAPYLRDQSQQSTCHHATNHSKAPIPTRTITVKRPTRSDQSQQSALPQASNHIKAPPPPNLCVDRPAPPTFYVTNPVIPESRSP